MLQMEKKLKTMLLLLGLLFSAMSSSYGVSRSCMNIYDEGGAPAVFQSPKCPDWVLSTRFLWNQTQNCQFSTCQGRRKYLEDRISGNLEMKIPFAGKDGPEGVKVGVVAVFDGHIGKEASEMASKLVLDYLFLHAVSGTHKSMSPFKEENLAVLQENTEDARTEWRESTFQSSEMALPATSIKSKRMRILEESLLRTIHAIDLAFTMASRTSVLLVSCIFELQYTKSLTEPCL